MPRRAVCRDGFGVFFNGSFIQHLLSRQVRQDWVTRPARPGHTTIRPAAVALRADLRWLARRADKAARATLPPAAQLPRAVPLAPPARPLVAVGQDGSGTRALPRRGR